MTTIDLSILDHISLHSGSHPDRSNGLCVMEAVAYVAGGPHSDHPDCACPILTQFLITWNDCLPSNAERDRLLKPLIPLIVGTRSTREIELRRSWMACDWLVRVFMPAWLDRVESLKEHARQMRGLDEITSNTDMDVVMPLLNAARDAAVAAAVAAARVAAAPVAAAVAAAGDAAVAAAARDAAVAVPDLQQSAVDLVIRMTLERGAA